MDNSREGKKTKDRRRRSTSDGDSRLLLLGKDERERRDRQAGHVTRQAHGVAIRRPTPCDSLQHYAPSTTTTATSPACLPRPRQLIRVGIPHLHAGIRAFFADDPTPRRPQPSSEPASFVRSFSPRPISGRTAARTARRSFRCVSFIFHECGGSAFKRAIVRASLNLCLTILILSRPSF